jgi:hypothetical protein
VKIRESVAKASHYHNYEENEDERYPEAITTPVN